MKTALVLTLLPTLCCLTVDTVPAAQPHVLTDTHMASLPLPAGLVRLPLALPRRAQAVLTASAARVHRRLYVSLQGDWEPLSVAAVTEALQRVYLHVARSQPDLDVRVLLPGAESEVAPGAPEIDVLIGPAEDEADLAALNTARAALSLPPLAFCCLEAAALADAAAASEEPVLPTTSGGGGPAPVCAHVCVGGTFDYLHVGHKLLLSLAAYCSSERLVCGVSDAPLLKKKSLRELMQPLAVRMCLVEDFVRSVKPRVRLELSALQDGYGPATRDAQLDAIVVSAETASGGAACNAKRQAGAHSEGAVLPPMQVITMPLVSDSPEVNASGVDVSEDTKVSSTEVRRSQLGRLRSNAQTADGADGRRAGGVAVAAFPEEEHWCRRSAPERPYVIGLTGGIACGKSTARRLLVEMAAADVAGGEGAPPGGATTLEAIDCDVIAHEAYTPGTPTFDALFAEFGSAVVGVDGQIDRKALGALVFQDDGGANMRRLTNIAWPATAALAAARIAASSAEVVVMEAAVLLEAGWEQMADEVWVVSASHAAVLERLAARNGLSAQQAEARVAKQMTSEERVARCHVPLSSAFGEEVMRSQLRAALDGAHRRRRQTLDAQPASSAAALFGRLCVEAGVPPSLAARWWGRIRDGMCAVGRRYHDMRHVQAMLGRVALLESRGLLRRPSLIRFAIFFHDVVYDATAKDNEAQSAVGCSPTRLLAPGCSEWLPSASAVPLSPPLPSHLIHRSCGGVSRRMRRASPPTTSTPSPLGSSALPNTWYALIHASSRAPLLPFTPSPPINVASHVLTSSHSHLRSQSGPASADLAHFLDTDLSVLGRDAAAYAEYAREIRIEYAHVPGAAFVEGRGKVLASFLAADRLYFSSEGAADFEAAARANLIAERELLSRRS